ncbi:MAG: hypothetical protein U0Y68_27225 [Blastocatellia bacterium]
MKPHSPISRPRTSLPNWWLALTPSSLEAQGSAVAISPQQHIRIAGDIWLANRAALLHELPQQNVTDAEIVAALWERHGEQCLARLQGMFAFAVWDERERSLRLVRDRVGARTLYYTTDGATRWIAPRLRTMAEKLAPTIDPVALRDYLCCAFVPGARTMWQGIREVRPGTIVRLPSNERRTRIGGWPNVLPTTQQPLSGTRHGCALLLTEVIRESLSQAPWAVICPAV